MKSRGKFSIQSKMSVFGTGIAGVLLYDLWTNFGCWLAWYPHTPSGLALCYTLTIPFTLWHLVSTSIAIALVLLPVMHFNESKLLKTEIITEPARSKAHTLN